ncbi:MAG: hypothetical protein EBY37_06355 [Flavobacteriia bacterium]|nr:hypothetical protein [Flavobacteriia bacterium]
MCSKSKAYIYKLPLWRDLERLRKNDEKKTGIAFLFAVVLALFFYFKFGVLLILFIPPLVAFFWRKKDF